jgi:hypothetical protein
MNRRSVVVVRGERLCQSVRRAGREESVALRRLGEFHLDDRAVRHGDLLIDLADQLRSRLRVRVPPGVTHRGQGCDHLVDVSQRRPRLLLEGVDLGGDALVLGEVRARRQPACGPKFALGNTRHRGELTVADIPEGITLEQPDDVRHGRGADRAGASVGPDERGSRGTRGVRDRLRFGPVHARRVTVRPGADHSAA